MVRVGCIICLLALTACETARYEQPIGFPKHGAAVRTNMAAHIIDPRPPSSRPVLVDSHRALSTLERYRADDVKVPNTIETSPAAATAQAADN